MVLHAPTSRVSVRLLLSLAISIVASGASLSAEESWTRMDKSGLRELYSPMTAKENLLRGQIYDHYKNAVLSRATDAPITIKRLSDIISVKISSNGIIGVNFDRSTLSREYTPAELENTLNLLRNEICISIEQRHGLCGGVLFFFSGQPHHRLFSDAPQVEMPIGRRMGAASGKKVVISAGHGYYYHHTFKKFTTQRDAFNGIIEDLVTPNFADRLSSYLTSRSSASPFLARNPSSGAYNKTAIPWRHMASRYYIKSILPKNPEIWNSYSSTSKGVKAGSREHTDDIYTRPKYANHLKATGILSLHTNGEKDGNKARGTWVMYQAGREQGKKLAENVYCYLKEQYGASNSYKNFKIEKPKVTNLAELREATSTGVLVEAAFHTNKDDAAAIGDSVFQDLVAKGIEKGWRLFMEGKGCARFAISAIPAASGPHNTSIPIEIRYGGYPQFPVVAKISVVECPSGWSCTGGDLTFENQQNSPLKYSWTCNADASTPTATFVIQTELRDTDGVTATAFKHNITCSSSEAQSNGQNVPATPTKGMAHPKQVN